jgi:hypothetical protein
VKKLRKVVTKKGKTAKAAQRRVAEQAALMMKQPTECCLCRAPFERTQETVKTWHVTVLQEKKVVRLTCPTCWKTVNEVTNEH